MDEKGTKRVNRWVKNVDEVNFGMGFSGQRVIPGFVGHAQWS